MSSFPSSSNRSLGGSRLAGGGSDVLANSLGNSASAFGSTSAHPQQRARAAAVGKSRMRLLMYVAGFILLFQVASYGRLLIGLFGTVGTDDASRSVAMTGQQQQQQRRGAPHRRPLFKSVDVESPPTIGGINAVPAPLININTVPSPIATNAATSTAALAATTTTSAVTTSGAVVGPTSAAAIVVPATPSETAAPTTPSATSTAASSVAGAAPTAIPSATAAAPLPTDARTDARTPTTLSPSTAPTAAVPTAVPTAPAVATTASATAHTAGPTTAAPTSAALAPTTVAGGVIAADSNAPSGANMNTTAGLPSVHASTVAPTPLLVAAATTSKANQQPQPFDQWLYSTVGDRVDGVRRALAASLADDTTRDDAGDTTANGTPRGSFSYNFNTPLVTATTCEGTLEGDYDSPDHPDCSILIKDYGTPCVGGGIPSYPMSMGDRKKKSPAEVSAEFKQIPHSIASDPYEQGYLIVPGLTDPATVATAVYEEYRRIDAFEEVRFPLVGVEAFIENPNRKGPHTHPTALERLLKAERERLLAAGASAVDAEGAAVRAAVEERAKQMNAAITDQPISIDIVYTYVNADEPRFKRDMAYYEKWREAPPKTLSMARKLQRFNNNATSRFAHALPFSVAFESAIRAMPREFTDGLLPFAPDGEACDEGPSQLNTTFARSQGALRRLVESVIDDVVNETAELRQRPLVISPAKRGRLFSNQNQRYRDYNELQYSLRAVYRHLIAPVHRLTRDATVAAATTLAAAADENSRGTPAEGAPPQPIAAPLVGISNNFGNIYIVACNKDQAPAWLRVADGEVTTVNTTTHQRLPRELLERVKMIEHADVYPNITRSLPNFNSNSIDTVLHRIKGLGRHFIFMNNDYFMSRPVSFFDYFMPIVVDGQVRFVTKPAPEKTTASVVDPSRPGFFDHPAVTKNFQETQKAAMLMMRNVMNPNHTFVPYVLNYAHYIHLFDRLHLTRMLTEPPIRRALCESRGQRKRAAASIMINVMGLYYSTWYLMNRDPDLVTKYHFEFGLGPLSNETALAALPKVYVNGPTPSEGRLMTTLWGHLYPMRATLPRVLAHMMNQSMIITHPATGHIQAPTSELLKVSVVPAPPQKGPHAGVERAQLAVTIAGASTLALAEPLKHRPKRMYTQGHWLFNAISSVVGLYIELEVSGIYRFATSNTRDHVRGYVRDYRVNAGRYLSVAVNDELPTVRDVPHPLFNTSQLLMDAVCRGYNATVLETFVLRHPLLFASIVQKYRDANTVDDVAFNVSTLTEVALDIAVDESRQKIGPRWWSALLQSFPSPDAAGNCTKRRSQPLQAFARAVAERMQAACVIGAAHESLAVMRYSVGVPSVGTAAGGGRERRGMQTFVDERVLLADASDPIYGGVYGGDSLIEGLVILSEGGAKSPYRNILPPWEVPRP